MRSKIGSRDLAGLSVAALAPALSPFAFAATLCVCAAPARAADAVLPDFSGFWEHTVPQEDWANPPGGGPGPVHRTMASGAAHEGGHGGNLWIGDYTNPILKPWTATALKKEGDAQLAGGPSLTDSAQCRPSGVPDALTLIGAMEILQAGDRTVFLYQRDNQVRNIYMNAAHDAARERSYYGDSVGHYEGDTLVVDTVGMNDRTKTDRFNTPHTDAIHVVERYRLTNGGKTLEAFFTVVDPGAFTEPWSGVQTYAHARDTLTEEVCAENNRGLKVPQAEIDAISGRNLR